MSVDHSLVIANDGRTELRLNIAGLDSESRSVDDIVGSVYAFSSETGTSRFTCSLSVEQLANLYRHLDAYEMIRDTSLRESGRVVQVQEGQEEILSLLQSSDQDQVILALRALVKDTLSQSDIDTILGRKDSLNTFDEMLVEPSAYTEPQWQAFLEENSWILGYGLRYKYLSILQREAHVSDEDVDGSNSVISDFLMSDNRFTKLVELKRPSTSLFKASKNRSKSWCLSSDLTDAVSQILTQKATWEIKSQQSVQFDKDDQPITEATHDVDCILLIGMAKEFEGVGRESLTKKRTVELFRRNLRNIDIVFFDELLERARAIVQSAEE